MDLIELVTQELQHSDFNNLTGIMAENNPNKPENQPTLCCCALSLSSSSAFFW